jgi:hypothetical protein
MQTNVSQSNATGVQAQEMCEQFITFIRERYPQINSIKFKLSRNGKHLALRARYKRRAVHADGRDFEKTMSCFMFYIILKLSIDKYYPTLEEMKEKRPLEPFFVKFNCSVHRNSIGA